jgi:hypothetical protein
MSASTNRAGFDGVKRGPYRDVTSGVNGRLCVACRARRALFRYRGVVKADADHTLCFQCFRALKNRERLANPWRTTVGLKAWVPAAKEMQ